MFKKYLVEAYFIDDLIFKKRFQSINNAIKVCCGFDNDITIEITNLISDRVYCNCDVKDMISEFIDELNEE